MEIESKGKYKAFGPPADRDPKKLKEAREIGLKQTENIPDFEGYRIVSEGLLETKEWVCPRCGRLNPCAVDCVQCQEPRIEGNFDVHQEGKLGENRDAASLNHLIIDSANPEDLE